MPKNGQRMKDKGSPLLKKQKFEIKAKMFKKP